MSQKSLKSTMIELLIELDVISEELIPENLIPYVSRTLESEEPLVIE